MTTTTPHWMDAKRAGTRLRLPEKTLDARSRLAALMRGEEPPERPWARQLPAEVVEELCDYMSVELTSLRDEVLWLVEALDVGDKLWCHTVLEWRHRRDDLESVFVIAATASIERVVPIRAAIAQFDAWSQRYICTLPPLSEVEFDERLRRVRLETPDAWWANL